MYLLQGDYTTISTSKSFSQAKQASSSSSITKQTVVVVHHCSIQGLGGCEYPGSFCRLCCYFPCYLTLPCKADQKSRISDSITYKGRVNDNRQTFVPFLSMIPTRSSKPTEYLPRFSPLCPPDNALNPITAAFIFHFPSFTSIQCAVIPWKPAFVVSADHPSCVTDIFPGAV